MADAPQDPGPSNMQPGWPPPGGGPPPSPPPRPPGPPPPAGPPVAGGPPPPGGYQAADGRWYPVQPPQQKSYVGLIVGLALGIPALLVVISAVCIMAITFLGTSASVKFESVGTAIDTPDVPTTTDRSRRTYTTETSSAGEALTPQEFEDELVSLGIERSTASCMVDVLEAGDFRFRDFGELSPAEEDLIVQATAECAFGEPGG